MISASFDVLAGDRRTSTANCVCRGGVCDAYAKVETATRMFAVFGRMAKETTGPNKVALRRKGKLVKDTPSSAGGSHQLQLCHNLMDESISLELDESTDDEQGDSDGRHHRVLHRRLCKELHSVPVSDIWWLGIDPGTLLLKLCHFGTISIKLHQAS
ncbi:hypothetical protein MRX96_041695 [Rhipicephalus microplus]